MAVMKRHILTLILSLILFGQTARTFAAPMLGAAGLPEKSQEEPSKPEGDTPLDEENQEKVPLTIHVYVPQNKRASNEFTVYPYPVETPTPHPRLTITLLTTNEKELKADLRLLGYVGRPGLPIPYPAGGYRLIYAYRKALKRYGQGQAHTLGELYRWIDEIYPYFRAEVLKSNEDELARIERKNAIQAQFTQYRADIEDQALKQGLSAQQVRIGSWNGPGQKTTIRLAKARWWIVGTHKLPGLTFYWQEPVDLTQGGQSVQLNDGNALLIEGAW